MFSASFPGVTSTAILTGGGGSSGTISGNVTNEAGGAAVAGGVVELYSGSILLATANPDGAGHYAFVGVSAGSYTLRYHAPLGFCLGSTEPDTRTVASVPGTADFVAQAGIRTTSFQSVANDTQLHAGTNWWTGTGYSNLSGGSSQIFLDATGSPIGDKAARYDWPATPWDGVSPLGNASSGYCGTAQTINLQPRADPFTLSELWVRVLCKESSNFTIGSTSCTGVAGISYKYLLVNVESGNNNGRFGTYLSSGAGSVVPTGITMDMIDRINGVTQHSLQPAGTALPNGFIGSWNAITLQIVGAGTASCSFKLYINDSLRQTLTNPFFPSTSLANWAMYVELGANINNGPDTAQSRWFREFGIYPRRPSMRAEIAT